MVVEWLDTATAPEYTLVSAGKARLLGRCKALVHQLANYSAVFIVAVGLRNSGCFNIASYHARQRAVQGVMKQAGATSGVGGSNWRFNPIEFPRAPLPPRGGEGPFLFPACVTAETAARVAWPFP